MHATHNEHLNLITEALERTQSCLNTCGLGTVCPMTVLSEAAFLGNKHNVNCSLSLVCCRNLSYFFTLSENIVTFCPPLHFPMLELVAKISPAIVFKSFHVIIFRKAAFAQESICSFYVYADNESK